MSRPSRRRQSTGCRHQKIRVCVLRCVFEEQTKLQNTRLIAVWSLQQGHTSLGFGIGKTRDAPISHCPPSTHRSNNSRLGVWTKSARDSWTTFASFDSVFGGAIHFPFAIMEILVQFADSDGRRRILNGVTKRNNLCSRLSASMVHQEGCVACKMHQNASPVHSDSQLQRNQTFEEHN
jgi:hypothetical protein